MKKQVLLTLGIIALVLAAREYGITSMDDLKKVLSPYLKAIDLNKIQLA